jgi:hypothetical protein
MRAANRRGDDPSPNSGGDGSVHAVDPPAAGPIGRRASEYPARSGGPETRAPRPIPGPGRPVRPARGKPSTGRPPLPTRSPVPLEAGSGSPAGRSSPVRLDSLTYVRIVRAAVIDPGHPPRRPAPSTQPAFSIAPPQTVQPMGRNETSRPAPPGSGPGWPVPGPEGTYRGRRPSARSLRKPHYHPYKSPHVDRRNSETPRWTPPRIAPKGPNSPARDSAPGTEGSALPETSPERAA